MNHGDQPFSTAKHPHEEGYVAIPHEAFCHALTPDLGRQVKLERSVETVSRIFEEQFLVLLLQLCVPI